MAQKTTINTVSWGICLSIVATLLALTVGLLVATQPVRANTYNVTNTNNSGAGSLRQAITDANTNPGADIIIFSTGVHSNLTGSSGEDLNVSGDLDILDSGDLTIQGNGVNEQYYTIIDAGENDRVFHICPGGGCTNSVTLIGMIIRDGEVETGVDGGGIKNEGTLNIQHCIIGGDTEGNTANAGGGIYNAAGTITVDDSKIINNNASYGAGIYNEGAAAILIIQNNTRIYGNTASSNGGGLSNHTGTMTVNNSVVMDNDAGWNGGGLHNYIGTVNIQNSSIIGKYNARNTAQYGGGIYNSNGGSVIVNSSTISANEVTSDGGGIYNTGATTTLSIQNNSIIGGTGAGNTAALGGGIYNESGTVTVDGSTVSANEVTSDGGGIYNTGATTTLSIQNNSIIGGTGAGNTAALGGGIYNGSGTATVDGSTISANYAPGGGGIYNLAMLNIQNNSTIGGVDAGNTAFEGGGIKNWAGTTTVDDSTVSANGANYGGGIFNNATLIVQNNSTIGGAGVGNTTTSNGAGIYNFSGTTTMDSSIISANIADNEGGGIYNEAGTTTVTGSCIIGNSVSSFYNNPLLQLHDFEAQSNWWGESTGPNTPGADTTGGPVDTSGYLTKPILGCGCFVLAPVLMLLLD